MFGFDQLQGGVRTARLAEQARDKSRCAVGTFSLGVISPDLSYLRSVLLAGLFTTYRSVSICTLQREKTRQEILDDIIARSKERKLEKARGKEEQESERERLDEGLHELLGILHQRPKGERSSARSQSDDYDLAMRVRRTRARALTASGRRH